jgi:hypothetical protein
MKPGIVRFGELMPPALIEEHTLLGDCGLLIVSADPVGGDDQMRAAATLEIFGPRRGGRP